MTIQIIDFAWNGTQTLFVDCKGVIEDKPFSGMVRIVDGVVYGDLVRVSKSNLSESAISVLKQYLTNKFQAGEFN